MKKFLLLISLFIGCKTYNLDLVPVVLNEKDFKNSNLNGLIILHKLNGELEIGKYKNGKRNGVFKFYNQHTFLYKEIKYKNDSVIYFSNFTPNIL